MNYSCLHVLKCSTYQAAEQQFLHVLQITLPVGMMFRLTRSLATAEIARVGVRA